MKISYTHSLSFGHRIVGHSGKCRMIHGHNFDVTFYVEGRVLENGMVLDYAKLKELGKILDREWDHRLLLWENDPIVTELCKCLQKFETIGSVKTVPFNPTSENIAQHVLDEFAKYGVTAIGVKEGPKTEAYVDALKERDDE